jgi:hypothetical protein
MSDRTILNPSNANALNGIFNGSSDIEVSGVFVPNTIQGVNSVVSSGVYTNLLECQSTTTGASNYDITATNNALVVKATTPTQVPALTLSNGTNAITLQVLTNNNLYTTGQISANIATYNSLTCAGVSQFQGCYFKSIINDNITVAPNATSSVQYVIPNLNSNANTGCIISVGQVGSNIGGISAFAQVVAPFYPASTSTTIDIFFHNSNQTSSITVFNYSFMIFNANSIGAFYNIST